MLEAIACVALLCASVCGLQQQADGLRAKLPRAGWLLYDEALKKWNSGDRSAALVLLEKLATQEPKSAWAQKVAADLAYLEGKYETALGYCDRAIKVDPKMGIAWNIRGHVNEALGRLKEAEEDFSRHVELGPDDPDAWYGRSRIRRDLGKNAEALVDIREALKRGKDIKYSLAQVLILCDNLQIDQAQKEIDRLVVKCPDYAELRMVRGLVLTLRSRDADADAEFSKAISLDPSLNEKVASIRTNALAFRSSMKGMLPQAPPPRRKPNP